MFTSSMHFELGLSRPSIADSKNSMCFFRAHFKSFPSLQYSQTPYRGQLLSSPFFIQENKILNSDSNDSDNKIAHICIFETSIAGNKVVSNISACRFYYIETIL
jgi:hypothetical protein